MVISGSGGEQMDVISLADFQTFSAEKMKKHSVFQTPRFFCDVYCFDPGQEQGLCFQNIEYLDDSAKIDFLVQLCGHIIKINYHLLLPMALNIFSNYL